MSATGDPKKDELIALLIMFGEKCTNLAKRLSGTGFFTGVLAASDLYDLEREYQRTREHAMALMYKIENPTLFRQFGPLS